MLNERESHTSQATVHDSNAKRCQAPSAICMCVCIVTMIVEVGVQKLGSGYLSRRPADKVKKSRCAALWALRGLGAPSEHTNRIDKPYSQSVVQRKY